MSTKNLVCDFITRVEWEPEHDGTHLKPAFDEIVTGPVDMVHIERMGDGTFWMAIYKGAARQIVVFHSTQGAKVFGRTEPDEA